MSKPWYQVARARAKTLGITYQAMADILDVSKSTVGHWLTGRNQARLDTIARIAQVLDCSVQSLLADDAYYLSDPGERALIDQVRELPPEYRIQAVAMLRAFAASVPAASRPAGSTSPPKH
jgi:transcriptional regulator with XRE-family HTH domain